MHGKGLPQKAKIGFHAAALLMRVYPAMRYVSMMLKGLVPVIGN